MGTRNEACEEDRRNLAIDLWNAGAVLTADSDDPRVVERRRGRRVERGFELRGERFSPFYFDFRTSDHPTGPGPLTPEIVDLAAQCLRRVELQECQRCEAIVGVPFAGNPFARALADIYSSDVEPIALNKTRGNERCYAASLRRRVPRWVQRVLVVDNIVTEAGPMIESIALLRKAKMEVVDGIALVDFQQGGRERLLRCGCALHSVFVLSQLFYFLHRVGKIKYQIHNNIQDYLSRRVA